MTKKVEGICPECRVCHHKHSSWFEDGEGIICDWCLNDIPYPPCQGTGKAPKADRAKEAND